MEIDVEPTLGSREGSLRCSSTAIKVECDEGMISPFSMSTKILAAPRGRAVLYNYSNVNI